MNILYISREIFITTRGDILDRNAIIAILVVVVIVIVAAFALSQSGQTSSAADTDIKFLNDSVKSGEKAFFQLTDKQGNGIANQNLTIEYNSVNATVTTDSQGKAYIVLDNADPGEYQVSITYNGTDKYNGCTKISSITVVAGDSASSSTSSTSNTSNTSNASGSTHYDPELGVNYDDNGIVIGGQSGGMNIKEVREGAAAQKKAEAAGATDSV